MSYFSTALTGLLERHRWTQQEASAVFQISTSAVGLYVTSRRHPHPSQLASMLRPLEFEDRQELLLAALKDSVPGEEFADLIMLEKIGASSRLREEAVAAWKTAPLPASVRAALDLIADNCQSNAELQATILSLAEFIRAVAK